jgi:hypothetical protein
LIIFLAIFATARLTRLVTADAITQPIRDRIERDASYGDEWEVEFTENGAVANLHHRPGKMATFQRFVRDLTDCAWCTSIWVGAGAAALAYSLPTAAFVWPALALTASHLTGLVAAFEGVLYSHQDDE